MKRKILAVLLCVCMLVTMIPPVFAADGDTNDVVVHVVEPEKFVKVTSDSIASGSKYMLVDLNNSDILAKNGSSLAAVHVSNPTDEFVADDVTDVQKWIITGSGSSYTFQNLAGQYMRLAESSASGTGNRSAGMGNTQNVSIEWENHQLILHGTYGISYYLHKNGTTYNTNWTKSNGARFTLYKFAESEDYWAVSTSAITAHVGKEVNYTSASWAPYQAALTAAQAHFADATAAQSAYDALVAAANALELVNEDVFVPSISWQRTNEPANDGANTYGDLVVGVPYIPNNQGNDRNYSIITWAAYAEQILALTTDPSMTVWDYNTSAQYASSVTKTAGIKAATWNEHEQSVIGVDQNWQNASVRLFEGTFIWPEGYDLDDTASLVSVNDANYADIYAAINKDSDLKSRFGNSHVIAVNDDMFVFMYKDGETLTTDNYLQHLVFFSGSSGKGRWCSSSTGADWGRTVPATFNGVSATPAYYRIMPNNADIDSSITTRKSRGYTDMYFSDGWYTLSNTSTITTTLKNLYADEDLSGQTMHIAIFAFDNNGKGGMDELEFKLTRRPQTSASVEVRYWLNEVTTTSDTSKYLGSSFMNDVEIGSTVTLNNGYNVNELNYFKQRAIEKNSNGDVENGHQVATITVKRKNNVVDVIYVPKGQNTIVLTAEHKEYEYDGQPKTANVVTVSEIGQASFTTTETTGVALKGGNYIQNIRAVKTETLPGIYEVNFGDVSVVTRYENGNSPLTNYTITRVPGTLTITYDPQPATVTYDFAVMNVYDVLNNVEKTATVSAPEDSGVVVGTDKLLYYYPSSVNTGESVELTLTFTGNYQVTKTVNFVPASNVLYEAENFAEKGESSDWDVECLGDPTVIVDDNDDTEFGYSDAYETDAVYSGNATLFAELTQGTMTKGVTFTFTGTGVDVVSACSENTGVLVTYIQGAKNKVFITDTYFSGDDLLEDDYQVPVVRVLDLPYGEYTVTVKGYLNENSGAISGTTSIGSGKKTQSMDAVVFSQDDLVAEILKAAGLSDVEDVTVSFMDENSVLNGGTGNMKRTFTEEIIGKGESDAELMSITPADGSDGVYVYVDAFRVYQPLATDPAVYGEKESGVTYMNLYDFACASASDLIDEEWVEESFLYVEYDNDLDVRQIAAYKNQGPQNELYLTAGNAIAIALEGYEEGDIVQVSAKAISGEPVLAGVDNDLSMTEMYYSIEVQEDSNVVLISNAGEEGSILAVNALKVSSNIHAGTNPEMVEIVLNPSEEETTFVPESFTVSYASSVKSGRTTTLTIKASKDVAKVKVTAANGDVKEYTPANATNKTAVASGKASTYSYSYTTAKLTAAATYTIVAYDADGNASEPIIVTITIK